MTVVDPSVILRLGSHSEKDYFEKVIRFLDGYIVAANLIEATPDASASLVFRFSGRKRDVPYYIDPMTYAFGAYIDPSTGRIRRDLDWIKSDQKHGRAFKRSYKALAEAIGTPFADTVGQVKNRNRAVSPSDFSDGSTCTAVCRHTADYQLETISKPFEAVKSTIP